MAQLHHAQRRLASPAALAACLFALALALYGATIIVTGFDGLIGQDPFGYYGYALQVRESVAAFRAPPPYYWPLGYPLLAVLAMTLLGPTPLAAQLAAVVCGAGVVAFTALLGYELARWNGVRASALRVGLVAGLVALSCGQLWQWSIVVMADTAALLGATLAAWGLLRYSRARRLPWLLLASGALAAAICSRWVYALLALPFGGYWVALFWTRTNADDSGFHSRQFAQISGQALFAALLGLALLAPQLALSARFEHPPLSHQWLVAWSPLNAFRRTFATPDGTATYPLPVALFYARAALSPRFLFPLLALLLAVGLLASVVDTNKTRSAADYSPQRRRGAEVFRFLHPLRLCVSAVRCLRAELLLLGGWLVAMYGFLCGVPYQNARFVLALLPPLAIFVGLGFEVAWGWLQPRWRIALLALLLASLAGGLLFGGALIRSYVAKKNADLAVARWVEGNTRPGDRLLAFELTLTLRHYTALDVRELFDQSPATLAPLVAEQRPLFLLVDTADLQTQWRGLAPERNATWLRDHPGLRELGELNGYTLFRVGEQRLGSKKESFSKAGHTVNEALSPFAFCLSPFAGGERCVSP